MKRIALFLFIAQSVFANCAIIDSNLVLEIDGKKVFPIGFTTPPPPDGKTPSGKNGIAELADAGATFMRTGGPWTPENLKREEKWMDAAARYGMYCLPFLRENVAVTSPQREQRLRQIINRFKNHPGLGAWKGEDEPEWGKQPVEPLLRGYQIIKELDPYHPMVLIQAPHGTVESLRKYNPTADVLGLDIYPIGYPPGTHSLVTNFSRGLELVGEYTRLMHEVGQYKMPVWMVLQISWSGVLKPTKTLRMPTFPEERFMTYEAIINGARGVVYFGGNNEGAMNERDKKLGWNWRFWDRVLRPVIEEIGTKSPLYPALVAPESDLKLSVHKLKEQPKKAGAAPAEMAPDEIAHDVEFCVRQAGNDIFLLACKIGGETERVEFSGLPPNTARADVLYEEPRIVQANAGNLTDWFAPYEVHVYRWSNGMMERWDDGKLKNGIRGEL